jgi:hypothetical protein
MSVEKLVEHFSALEDPRCAGKVEHLQIEDIVLQQRDALGQLALASTGRRVEDPGDNLVYGSLVCHWSTSSSLAEFNQRFFNHGVAAG